MRMTRVGGVRVAGVRVDEVRLLHDAIEATGAPRYQQPDLGARAPLYLTPRRTIEADRPRWHR